MKNDGKHGTLRDQLLLLRAVLVSIVALASAACGPRLRVERSTVGDTVLVRTHVPARMDSARLEIVARYRLPSPDHDSIKQRISALTVTHDGAVVITTETGSMLRLGEQKSFVAWTAPPDDEEAAQVLNRLQTSRTSVADERSAHDLGSCRSGSNDHFQSGNFADIRQRYVPSVQRAA